MTTELGRKLRKIAEEMAKAPDGSVKEYGTVANLRGFPDGTTMNAIKDGDGGQRAGLDYSLEALGAKKARGEDVEEETQLLIERAKKLKLENPEETVRVTIYSWQRNAEFADKKKKGSI